MRALELLIWTLAGIAVAVITIIATQPREHKWPTTIALAIVAADVGGLIGLGAMRPAAQLGDYNPTSMLFATGAAALALLVEAIVRTHRGSRPPRPSA